MSLAKRAERAFEAWAHIVIRRRGIVALASLAIGFGLAAGLPRLELNFSSEAFLGDDDQTRRVYDAFRARWGDDEFMLVGIEPPAVFDPEFLAKLRDLHEEFERELPHVDELTSLINARDTRAEGDTLLVAELFDPWPADAAALARIEARVRDDPAFQNRLISRDHDYTAILIRLDAYSSRDEAGLEDVLGGFDEDAGGGAPAATLSNEEQNETLEGLYEIVGRYEAPDFRVSVSGGPVLMHHMQELNARDVKRYTTSAFGLIFVLLYLLFRRVTATLVPLLVVLVSVLSTFGAMGWLGIPVTLVTQSVPSFLMAVAVCDSMHILAIAYRRLAAGRSQAEALVDALGHSGFAVVLTSITTAGGLVSFRAAELQPISDLGIASPLGVLFALFFSLTTLPALLAIAPLRAPRSSSDSGAAHLVDRVLRSLGDTAIARPGTVVLCTALLVVVAAFGLVRLRSSNSALEWFYASDPVRQAVLRIDAQFEGIQPVEVLIDSRAENGLHEPTLLRAMERASARGLETRVGPVKVASAISLVDVVKESHRALHADDPRFYAIPAERPTVAQELLLFENGGADDLERLVDTRFREARLTFTTNWADGADYVPFLDRLEAGLREDLGPGVDFVITGDQSLFARAWMLLIPSMLRSYALALLIITPLMVLLVGNWRRGLLAMIPNLVPVYLTLALMGALDLPISITTLIIGSMILGIAVDDTIHFMHKFNQYEEEGRDVAGAIRETLATTGVALFATSVALGGSYLIYTMASFRGLMQFGLLASFAIVVAFLADMLLAPALLMLASRRKGARAGASA